MKAILVEPGEYTRLVDTGTTVADQQALLRGEPLLITPFGEEGVAAVISRSAAIAHAPFNRLVGGGAILGTFLVVGIRDGQLAELTTEQQRRYLSALGSPEVFDYVRGGISSRKVTPAEYQEEMAKRHRQQRDRHVCR